MKTSLLSGIALTVAVLAIVAVPVGVSAETVRRERVQDRRCTIAENRITTILARMQNINSRHQAAYERMRDKAQLDIQKLGDKGYDTTSLEAALTELKGAIKAHKIEAQKLYSNTESTQDFACGESEGAFVNALNTSRDQIGVVRASAQAVRTVFQQEVVPELKTAAQWLRDNPPTVNAEN